MRRARFQWCFLAAILLAAVGCRDQKGTAPESQYGKAAPAREEPEVRPVAKPYSADAHFKRLDRNGDGVLNLEEFLADRQGADEIKKGTDVFALLDRDHDGKLTPTEFTNRSDRARFRELHGREGGLDFKDFWRGTLSWASQRHAERLFQVLDKDHDGKISQAEYYGRTPEGWFLPMDRNEDGFLSYEEFGQGHPNLVKNKQCHAACELMDTNHDGKLSLEEVTIGLASPEVNFYKKDVDGDGRLTFPEFSAGRTPEALAAAQKEFVDKDIGGDGSLSLEEFKTPREQARFRRLDRDGDGFLAVEEFCAGIEGKELASARQLFKAKDANGDKKLDLAEFSGRSRAVEFAEQDTDADGSLSLGEFLAGRGVSQDDTKGAAVFATLDRDQDGKLSLAEFSNRPVQAGFRELDDDGDGYLDFREFHKGDMGRATVEHAKRVFKLVDRDGDGKISLSEFADRTREAWFARMDLDGDGSLSLEEYSQANSLLVRFNRCKAAFDSIDKNHDGRLSLEEYNTNGNSPVISFYGRDVDGDGKLTLAEYSVWSRTPEALTAAQKEFQEKDVDGDGRLTMEEFKTSAEDARFAKLDKDRDGFLSLEEFSAGAKDAARAKNLFLAKDANGDKRLDRTEFASRSAKVGFLERDIDGDEHLSLAEYLGDRKDPEVVRVETAVFAILDANRDGKLSFAELQAYRPEVTFRRLDREGKGSLDFEAFRNGEMKSATEKHAKRVFDSLDQNHDGKLTQEEYTRRSSECWFCLMDTDDDGYLTLEEYGKGTPQLVRNKHLERAFRALDRNGDGKVTVEEYRQPQWEVDFLKRDENGDGVLSWEEFASTASNPQALAAAKKEFQDKDVDGDGRLTLEELKRSPEEIRFAKLDKDRDGFVSLEEFSVGASGREVARLKRLFLAKDANGDKRLDRTEFAASSPLVEFLRHDSDGDGLLDFKEFWKGTLSRASERHATKLFQVLDKDRDGKISPSELHDWNYEGWFLTVDHNEDGFLSYEEFGQAHTNLVKNKQCQAACEFMDTNHDGKLSLEEARVGLSSPEINFYKKDIDGDGKLTLEEFSAGVKTAEALATAKRQFQDKDVDGDGRLTMEEFKRSAEDARFTKFDKNRDGSLSLEEFSAGATDNESARLKRLFVAKDSNGDEKMDRTEFALRSAMVGFLERDLDGDEHLSLAEYLGDRKDPEVVRVETAVFAILDADRDGNLSFAELQAYRPEASFRRLDREGKGSLDFETYRNGEMKSATEKHAKRVFDSLDQNHDGKLTQEEYTRRSSDCWFCLMDTDDDGHLTMEEYGKGTPQLVRNKHLERAFRVLDQNGDGKVTVEEYRQPQWEADFLKRDENGDGVLSWEEFASTASNPQALAAAKKELQDKDIDGDGRLTLEEFKRSPEEIRFAKLDKDRDGFVSLEEFSVGASGKEVARLKRLFLAKDANGDKRLDRTEFAASSPLVEFLRHDSDGDGLLDFKEFWQGTLSWASERHAARLFQVLDKDHDKKVSLAELESRTPEGWFLPMDRNEDGFLSYEEFGKGNSLLVRTNRCKAAFASIDKNHDGRLSLEEYNSYGNSPEISFYGRDADGDGKLTFAEYSVWYRTPEALAAAKKQFGERDIDGDGRLTLEEFKRSAEDARFAKLDKDRDGFLSLEEFSAGATGKEAARAKNLFLAKDRNGDKKLDPAEFAAASPMVEFLRRDLDGDGLLDFKELWQGMLSWASERHAMKVLQALDRDHDKKVSLAELESRTPEGWILPMDRNEDGFLSYEEFGQAHTNLVKNKQCQTACEFMDTDHDGKLSLEEVAIGLASPEINFYKKDVNGDGQLTFEEFSAGIKRAEALASAKRQFHDKDVDGDGRLTLDEFKRNLEQIRFAKLDKDRDGFLSLEEFSAGATGTEAARAKNLFLAKDRNGDKKLDFTEFLSRSAMVEFYERDLDGDGFWSLTEVIGDRKDPRVIRMATDVFAILDANHDGKLSYAELHSYRPRATFRRLDREGTGSLTFEEFRNGDMKDASEKHAKRVFDSLDRNHDGKLTLEEYCQRSAEAWVCLMDANDDGHLSLEEYGKANQHLVRSKHLERAFRALDRNGDGKVDAAEYGQGQEEVEFLKRDEQGKGALTFEQYASSASNPEALVAAKKEFTRRDSDGNGLLSFKEFAYRAEDRGFWEMDKKGDYCVTQDEFVAFTVSQKGFLGQTTKETKEARAAKLFALLDRNHDLVLMWDEFRSQPATVRFQRMDLNGDSFLSLEEYSHGATPQERAKAEKEFKAKDKTGDGKLTLAEYLGKK